MLRRCVCGNKIQVLEYDGVFPCRVTSSALKGERPITGCYDQWNCPNSGLHCHAIGRTEQLAPRYSINSALPDSTFTTDDYGPDGAVKRWYLKQS